MRKIVNDTIVALFKDKNDFLIARDENWYRIPARSRVPEILKDGTVKYISFYFKKEFGDWKYSIRHYAKIYNVQQVRRRDLMPHQPYHPQANALYYKISFEPLRDLPKPIISQRGRIIIFIPTTLQKLYMANDFNDIFSDSPLEETLWAELKKNNLPAERQFFFKDKRR